MTEESSTHQSRLEVTDVTNKSKSPTNECDDIEPTAVPKKRLPKFSDSESDLDKDNTAIDEDVSLNKLEDSYNTIEGLPQEKFPKRSRIRNTAYSESDTNSSSEDIYNTKQKKNYESLRTEHKKKSLKEKFKKLTAPRSKSEINETENLQDNEDNNSENSENEISCLKIKHKIRKSAFSMNSICDPDTSDEEGNKEVIQHKKKHKSKMTKPTSPKPIRMSAKQAMENMQKIKSESNRMLREKQVSLPYHRPKALSLKDIMSRRKPAITSDGKALPIKMNNEQLKQYAMMLEQRQKEVIELCKSDSEEDDTMEHDEQVTDNILNDINNTNNEAITCENLIVEEENVDEVNETVGVEKEIPEGDKQDSENIETKENLDEERETLKYNQNMDDEKDNFVAENRIIDKEEETIDKDKPISEEEKEIIDEEIQKQIVPDNKSINENPSLQNSSANAADMDTIRPYKNIEQLPKDVPNSEIENESQVLDLQYDSEIYVQDKDKETVNNEEDEFLDNDFSFDEISRIIEEAESTNDVSKIEQLTDTITNTIHSNLMPKLTGGPGMFIDLDNGEATSRKLSGVELLKERFAYYSTLKSREDMEKDREKKYKPGTQHLKLKQELEEQIAEQRSVEWEKRLQEESKLKSEMTSLSDDDDDIEKIEAKLEEVENDEESSEGEEEPIENDIILEDKPMKRNPMVDDEAEVSEDETLDNVPDDDDNNDVDENKEDDDIDDESSDSSSEDEEESKPRKGRILKAFEDSDDESNQKLEQNDGTEISPRPEPSKRVDGAMNDSQDDELQLAQRNKSSDDLFSTQESDSYLKVATLNKNNSENISTDLGTQTFSIMNSVDPSHIGVDLISPEKDVCGTDSLNKLSTDCPTSEINTECFSLNFTPSQNQSQEIGDDVAALCTGKFYDNVFVSQNSNKNEKESAENSQEIGDDVVALCTGKFYDNPFVTPNENIEPGNVVIVKTDKVEPIKENTILKSILDELDEPEAPKQKYFFSNSKEVQDKKKFVIDSDDETNDGKLVGKRKKLKKRKAEERALHISDDEEDEFEEEEEDYVSDMEEEGERVVEYDSEENEVEIPQKPEKRKKMGEFFENEAELTSEDEWMGSGDEDERGLDRMEREEGDDDKFHQGQLQRELGQIHMREVLDQDKREVRLIQELLFEDGDLGDGHRQRKFRWKNADGETETGTNPEELADTQEEEFESEEQWRKQRHEREMFLRQMQENNEDKNTSINRSAIIKANLNSRNSTSIVDNMNKTENETKVPEKKTSKDIPSPKKPFTIFQQNYHNSLLTRGRGALARLAALATPLVTDDGPTSIAATNGRNFVFAVKEREEPKVTKRKAESNVNTPRLIKKMKTEETIKKLKSSLFDHFKR